MADGADELIELESTGVDDSSLWGSFQDEAGRLRLSLTRGGSVRVWVADSRPIEIRVELLAQRAEEPAEPTEPIDDESTWDTDCHLGGSETLQLEHVTAWERRTREWLIVLHFQHEWALEADYGRCGGVIREERSGNASGFLLIDVAAELTATIHTEGVAHEDSTPPMSGTSTERSCYDEVPDLPWLSSWSIVCSNMETSEIEFGSGGGEREASLELERLAYQCIDDTGCDVQVTPLAEFSWHCANESCESSDEGDPCPASCYDDADEDGEEELAPEDRSFTDTNGGRGWGERCFRHLQARRFAAARAACRRGLAIARNNDDAGALHYNLGRVAEEEGELDEARREYRRSLELRPNNRTVQRRLDGLRPND